MKTLMVDLMVSMECLLVRMMRCSAVPCVCSRIDQSSEDTLERILSAMELSPSSLKAAIIRMLMYTSSGVLVMPLNSTSWEIPWSQKLKENFEKSF